MQPGLRLKCQELLAQVSGLETARRSGTCEFHVRRSHPFCVHTPQSLPAESWAMAHIQSRSLPWPTRGEATIFDVLRS